ncbi:baseplate wedge subunit [Vibrio phage K469]
MAVKHNIVNADFDGMTAGIRQALESDPFFKDYNFEGAGLSAIIRILATQGSQQAFTDNMMFNEGFLKTSEMVENAGAVSSFLSYVPGSINASKMIVDITVTPTAGVTPPTQLVLGVRDYFIAVKDGKSYQFAPKETYTAELVGGVYVFKKVELFQGIWTTNTFDVNGSAIDGYAIPNRNADINSLNVRVFASSSTLVSETYNRYKSPFDLGAANKLFFVQMNREGLYEIEFGDGILSKKLDDLNVVSIEYLVTKGADGNDINSAMPMSSIGGFPTVSVNVTTPSAGGSEAETIDSIKHNAPLVAGRHGAIVGSNDYIMKAKESHPDADVASWGGEDHNPIMQGYQVVAIRDKEGRPLSADAKTALVETFRKYRVGSIEPFIVDGEMLYINVESEVYWTPLGTSDNQATIKTAVIAALRKWSSDKLENFKTEFILGDMSDVIKAAHPSIKTDVTSIVYQKRYTISDIFYQPPVTLEFNKDILAGSIMISGIKMGGEDVTIQDGDKNGSLFIYKGAVKFSPNEIGKVDYKVGTVSLHTTKFSSTSAFISVNAKAATINQNLGKLRNHILKLGDINIQMRV